MLFCLLQVLRRQFLNFFLLNFPLIKNILTKLWPTMSLFLVWLPDMEKTWTSTEDCERCCSERSSCPQWERAPGHPDPAPLTLMSLVTASKEPVSKPTWPNPAARKAGTCWRALLAVGSHVLNFAVGMLEKPSGKTQVLDFFESRCIYFAVESSWCHCSCATGSLHAPSTPPIPQTEVGLFHPK